MRELDTPSLVSGRYTLPMKEHRPHHAGTPLTFAECDGSLVRLIWAGGERASLPLIWLRDHCPCDACRHPQTFERTYALVDGAVVPSPRVSCDSGNLLVRWGDDHISRFDAGWLLQRRPGAALRGLGPLPRRNAWKAAYRPHRTRFDDYLADGEERLAWLEALHRDGLALLIDGPSEGGEIDRVAGTIGPIRPTNFGARFEVFSKPDPNNAAYTSIALELHTDLPNWREPPDIQMLYCLANEADGGDSVFGDGMAMADALRAQNPEAFHLLSETAIDFRFADEGADIVAREPVIGLDETGGFAELRFNNWIRDALRLPLEEMQHWYAAYRELWSLVRNPDFRINIRLGAGEMVAFDNRRVLHGRKSFDPSTGRRHLQGCYIDRDMVESVVRVLGRERDAKTCFG